jgi:hypothetical protein
LSKIDGIDPAVVTHEYAFRDDKGKDRRIDFLIDDPSLRRSIAIEIDGRNKTGARPTRGEHDDFMRRQNAITAHYHLLRFTNAQVRDHPDWVRGRIQAALDEERTARQHDLAQINRVRDEAGKAATDAAIKAFTKSVPPTLPPTPPPSPPPAPQTTIVPPPAPTHRKSWPLLVAAAVAVVFGAIVLFAASGGGDLDRSGVEPVANFSCPDDYPVKGNISATSGEQIYHVPGGQFYERTNPVRCFALPEDAEANGFRRSQR